MPREIEFGVRRPEPIRYTDGSETELPLSGMKTPSGKAPQSAGSPLSPFNPRMLTRYEATCSL